MRSAYRVLALGSIVASSVLTACSPKAGTTHITTQSGATTYELEQPTVTAVSSTSTQTVIGDTMQVFGANFIDPQHGTLVVAFTGSFTDQNGATTPTPVEGIQLPLTYVTAGLATFVLGPDNVLGPSGTIGHFNGVFQVANRLEVPAANAETGDTSVSSPQSATIVIGPSIFLDDLHSVANTASPCVGVTSSTTGAQNVQLGFHYVGMEDASAADPVTYTVSYDPNELTVAYVADQTYGSWPFWGPTSPNAQASVATGAASFSTAMTSGHATAFDPQSLQMAVTVNPPVTINQVQLSDVKLAGLATPTVGVGITQPVLLTIVAQHQSGASITRTVSWTAKGQVSMGTPSPTQLVAWSAATQNEQNPVVCGVAGSSSTTVTYQQSSSDSQQRSITMNWSVNDSQMLSASLSSSLGILGTSVSASGSIAQTWSQTFGTDVSQSDTVTSEQSSSTTTPVLAGECVAFYLQWGEQHSSVDVNYNDACGNSQSVGVATLVSHLPYIAIVQSTQNPPPCPAGNGPNECHPAGPISN